MILRTALAIDTLQFSNVNVSCSSLLLLYVEMIGFRVIFLRIYLVPFINFIYQLLLNQFLIK
jgi:hypothetical protein